MRPLVGGHSAVHNLNQVAWQCTGTSCMCAEASNLLPAATSSMSHAELISLDIVHVRTSKPDHTALDQRPILAAEQHPCSMLLFNTCAHVATQMPPSLARCLPSRCCGQAAWGTAPTSRPGFAGCHRTPALTQQRWSLTSWWSRPAGKAVGEALNEATR